ncbi:Rhodanese- sulfurtransferase [Glugoides intestinalis]
MSVYQQILTVTAEQNERAVNDIAREKLIEMKNNIKSNVATRIEGSLVYETVKSSYVLPKSINENKEKTKWELFAEEKGIKKKKKSRSVFSEKLNKWVPRYGSRSEQNLLLQGGVVAVEQSMSKMLNEKRARVAKNKKNADKNKKLAKK